MSAPITQSTAVLSADGLYRYRLTRAWDERTERVTFVMLNPSTADASTDDPTIRRCIGFARSWGYGGLDVVNLYALRSTNPAALWTADDPVGPENNATLTRALLRAPLIVAAWGANAKPDRVGMFWSLAKACEATVHALRVTQSGAPGHPLYIPATATPQPYAEASR